MIEKILYLSSIEPTVLAFTYPSLYNINFEDKATCIVPMVKDNNNIKYVVNIPMLRNDSPYISTVWNRDNSTFSWERNYIESSAAGQTTTIYYANIKIKYFNPSYFYTPIPYWLQTKVEIINPLKLSSYANYVIKQEQNTNNLIGNILDLKDIQSTDDYWIKEVPKGEQEHVEPQNIIRPGEYFSLFWEVIIDNTARSQSIINIPFETPLFTGGVLLGKTGTGTDTRYTAKIYDTIYTDIIPTDFFEYKIGKWAYFLKDVTLSGGHQKYGSSNVKINDPDAKYRLTPFNFYGNPHYDVEIGMAIDYKNDLAIDFTTDFEKIFDMLNYTGQIKFIDYENDSAIVYINSQFINIPIFYHCASTPITQGGSKAFKVDDNVIISCPLKVNLDPDFDNARIIGFQDNLLPCDDKFRFLIYREDGEEITDTNIGMNYIDFYNSVGDWIWTEFSYNTTLALWEITFIDSVPSGASYFVTFTCPDGIYIEYPRTFEIEEMQNPANLLSSGTYFVSIPICFRERTWTPNPIHINAYNCPTNNPDINSFNSVVNSLNPDSYGDFLMFNDNYKTLEQKITFKSSLDYKVRFSTDAGFGTYIKYFETGQLTCSANHDDAKITVISSDYGTVVLEPYLVNTIDAVFTTVFDATYTHHIDEVRTMLTPTQVNVLNNISVLRGVWRIDINGQKTGNNLIFNSDWTVGQTDIVFDIPLYDILTQSPINLMLDYIELPGSSLMNKEHVVTYYDQSTIIAERRYTALDGYIYMMAITSAPYRINFNSNYQSGF